MYLTERSLVLELGARLEARGANRGRRVGVGALLLLLQGAELFFGRLSLKGAGVPPGFLSEGLGANFGMLFLLSVRGGGIPGIAHYFSFFAFVFDLKLSG